MFDDASLSFSKEHNNFCMLSIYFLDSWGIDTEVEKPFTQMMLDRWYNDDACKWLVETRGIWEQTQESNRKICTTDKR